MVGSLKGAETSSPRKCSGGERLGTAVQIIRVSEKRKNRVSLRDQKEAEKEDEDDSSEEMYNSSMLSPVRIEETSVVGEKVTSFEAHRENGALGHVPESPRERAGEEVDSEHGEADVTIQQLKDLIESKKRLLNEKEQMVHDNGNAVGARGGIDEQTGRRVSANRHKKTLHQLIRKIHREPYGMEWSAVEWRLFQRYLNEWRLSGDDNMFQELVLQDLFNCSVDVLRIRMKSLTRFVHWKRRTLNRAA